MLLAADNRADVVLYLVGREELKGVMFGRPYPIIWMHEAGEGFDFMPWEVETCPHIAAAVDARPASVEALQRQIDGMRSEEHTSELQSLMRSSYAVFYL